MGLAAPFFWQPMPVADLVWAGLYGVVLFVARWLLVIALRDLAAHAATSLMKLQFVWMVLIGAAVFGEWPAANTYLGVSIVVGSGFCWSTKISSAAHPRVLDLHGKRCAASTRA